MKDQHSISFLFLNHLHTSTLLVIDNFISQLPCNLEDLQYALEIKMNVRGVLVRRMSYSTYSLRRCRRQKRTAFSSPFCFQQHWRHRRLAALSPLYLPRWWTHTSPATPYIHPSVCTYYRAGGFVFFSRAGSINAAGPLFPTMFVLVITNIYLLSRQHIMLVVA